MVWGVVYVVAIVSFAVELSRHSKAEMLIVQRSNDHLQKLMQLGTEELEVPSHSQTVAKTILAVMHDGFGRYVSHC